MLLLVKNHPDWKVLSEQDVVCDVYFLPCNLANTFFDLITKAHCSCLVTYKLFLS